MQAVVTHLGTGDRERVEQLLGRDPITNVYLISECRSGMQSPYWWGLEGADGLRSVMLAGALVVPYIDNKDDAVHFAEVLSEQEPPVRMVVGHKQSVLALHANSGWQARGVREPQPVLTIDAATLRGTKIATPLRHSTRADLELLSEAAAAMHHEEIGVDPLRVDPDGWRLRMAQLVERGWSWIWTEGNAVVFKAELSAWTNEAAQIQGVYTNPAWRRRGVARAAMVQLCQELLRTSGSCTLYVNHYNTTARRLYADLGFQQSAEFATVIY